MLSKLLILTLLIFSYAGATDAAQVNKNGAKSSSIYQAPKAKKAGKPNNDWRSNIIQVHPGSTVAFLLQGRQYAGLDRVRAIQYQRRTSSSARGNVMPSRPTQHIRPRFGESTHQGRWVNISANKNAPTGAYWIEGLLSNAKTPAIALPVVIEVVSSRQKIRRPANLPGMPKQPKQMAASRPSSKQLAVPNPAAKRAIASDRQSMRQAQGSSRAQKILATGGYASTTLVATVPLSGNALQVYDSTCGLNSAMMQQILEQGGTMPCAGNASTSGSSTTTYLLSHSPIDVGEVGAQLTIIASNLTNPQNVRVSLAGQQLSIISASVSRLEVRLPSQPTSGALIVARSNGEVLGNLNNAYQVVTQPTPVTELFADFSGTQSSVSWKLGYQMSLLSWLAYFDDLGDYLENNRTFSARLGVRVRSRFDETRYGFDVCHIASGSMQGVVFEHEESNSVIVSIRGSQTSNALQDWWDNDLDPQPFPRLGWAAGSSIHCGFHQAAKVVFDKLLSELKDDYAAGKKIWITGHSLGGASAVLLAAMLEWDAAVQVTGVYTFGAPGMGNFVFINAYNNDIPNTHRFELQFDPVVSLYYPLHGRPGQNHLLHADGTTSLNAGQGYLVYPGVRPFTDLAGVHMEYWCRGYAEMDEATSENLRDTLIVPPANPDGSNVCDVSNFYSGG